MPYVNFTQAVEYMYVFLRSVVKEYAENRYHARYACDHAGPTGHMQFWPQILLARDHQYVSCDLGIKERAGYSCI